MAHVLASGVKHATDLSRRDRLRHRLAILARTPGPAAAGRLRPLPGPEAIPPAQLGRLRGGARRHRRDRADPCPPRPQRLCAAARTARLPRPSALQRRHARPVPAAARLGAPARGRGRLRQPPRVLEAPSGTAALHRRRCQRRAPTLRTTPVRWALRADPRRSRDDAACRPPARRRQPAHRVGLAFAALLGRPRARRRPADAPAGAAPGERMGRDRVDLRRPRARRRRPAGCLGRRDQPHCRTRRHRRDPGLRRRPRAGAAVRPEPARAGTAHSRPAGVPQQPDGRERRPASTNPIAPNTGCRRSSATRWAAWRASSTASRSRSG